MKETPTPSGVNYQRVRDVVRMDILTGVFAPGDRLKINDLVERYDVGANPIREALQQLRGEGLVEMIPNKGATVRYLDERVTRQMLELRQAIELMVARKFAQTGSYKLLDELKRAQERFEQAVRDGHQSEYHSLNNAFHDIIIRAADNQEAELIMSRTSLLIRAVRESVGYGPERIGSILAEHRALLDAFEQRDAEKAGEIAWLHASRASDDLLDQYRRMMKARMRVEPAGQSKRSRVPRGWTPDLAQKRP